LGTALSFSPLHLALATVSQDVLLLLLLLLVGVVLAPYTDMAIETPHAYAIATAGFFIALLLLRVRSHFKAWIGFAHRMTLQHLVYPRLIRRHRFLGPWSRADVLAWMLFVAANTFCLAFGASSLGDAGRRAARLSLVNLIPAYGGPHLSFLADFFGVSLRIFRLIHRSAGMMALPLLAFHVATAMITHTPFPLRVAGNMWGLVVCSSPAAPAVRE
jgi:hypothetical protein